jgi:hypothetical protein
MTKCVLCHRVRETIDFAARVQGVGIREKELQRVRLLCFCFLHAFCVV